MLHLTKGNTADHIIVTFSEKKTLPSPTYRVTFTHVVTKEVIAIDLIPAADLSSYPERFNEYVINTATVFATGTDGQWQYDVIELTTDVLIENGKMKLAKATDFNFNGYEPATTYKGYGG
jgi:hypothetical protein